ncbi:MAG TPA: glycosyltransferase [Thermomicrobiales bacterium]|nr:glycosyltransferase [Thermomicrobiales bacterium]
MTTVTIGIHVHAEARRLAETLASVRANTGPPHEVVLLPDGPEPDVVDYLATLPDLHQLGTQAALGPPACFNRLALAGDADVLVLLESGAVVGPGWLELLLAAFEADPTTGIVGPSTNRAWNEQAVVRQSGSTLVEVAAIVGEVRKRFGAGSRTLEPLHSLADFCYVVRREVVERIGAADEGYGLGPCWEMDYNIRAVRAGFRVAWVGGAYVQRAPFTPRRRRAERLLLDASRRRYQDAFCGLRLTGSASGYQPHCRGEACEHFAPPDLIRRAIPLRPSALPEPPVAPASPPPVVAPPEPATHLVSCIMPTGNRARFALQAIALFQRQDYADRELIVVDDGDDDLEQQLPADPRIRYLRVPRGLTIGAKRNRACDLARGTFIAHWDDDDWYAPDRLRRQLAPLLAGEAEISGLRGGVILDVPRWAFWTTTPELHRRLFVGDVHGGTLVYQRRLWEQVAKYPNRSLAEDAIFLRRCRQRRARLAVLENNGQFVYLRHASNSWSFACGSYLDPAGWLPAEEPDYLRADRAFLTSLSPAMSAPVPAGPIIVVTPDTTPLVSCIMPTADRREFVRRSIADFQRQDYPNRELIVVDDGEDAVADLLDGDPRIRYLRLSGKRTLGEKRNIACREAGGDYLLHWDDDDWMAARRIRVQIGALRESQADVCGLDRLLYHDPAAGLAWEYVYPGRRGRWVAGNTLCYTRALWLRNPFINAQVGEDTRFLRSRVPKKIVPLADTTICIGRVHPGNTSPKHTTGSPWRPVPLSTIEELLRAESVECSPSSVEAVAPSRPAP